MVKLTAPQRKVLGALADGPQTREELGASMTTLNKLKELGLVDRSGLPYKGQPSPPTWFLIPPSPERIAEAVKVAIERGKKEIAEDIASGRVPATVTSFADLHDYVDANEYGGLCDEDSILTLRPESNEVQDALDAWIKARPTDPNHDRSLPDDRDGDDAVAGDGLLGCVDCGQPLYYCKVNEQYYHVAETGCFLHGPASSDAHPACAICERSKAELDALGVALKGMIVTYRRTAPSPATICEVCAETPPVGVKVRVAA